MATMTVEEYDQQSPSLVCRMCGHVGLVRVSVANNGGERPGCPSCGHSTPLLGVQFLKKNSAASRRVKRPSGDPSPADVWEANGNTCAFCGKTREECERFGIGITNQHVVPFAEGGESGPLIPFCARCQQQSTAAQAETKRIRNYVESITETIERLRVKQAALDRERQALER